MARARDRDEFAGTMRKKVMPGDTVGNFKRTMMGRLMPGGTIAGMADTMRPLVQGAQPFPDDASIPMPKLLRGPEDTVIDPTMDPKLIADQMRRAVTPNAQLQDEDAAEAERREVGKVLADIEAAYKKFEHWRNRCKRIRDRYTDRRNDATVYSHRPRRYSILWSNIQVLYPALYSRMPEPNVTRRWKTQDTLGLTASTIIERGINWNLDVTKADVSFSNAVYDNLLYARGVLWARYEPAFKKVKNLVPVQMGPDGLPMTPDGESIDPDEIEMSPEGLPMYEGEPVDALEDEKVFLDYVNHDDFIHEPARTWDEVTWVARRVFMSKRDATERFGAEVARELKYTAAGSGTSPNDTQMDGSEAVMVSRKKVACIYEVWNKAKRTVCWVSKEYEQYLDEGPPPYKLDGFFPCPRPYYGTITTDSLEPIPDYTLYQDQAEELDELTIRIGKLIEALRLVGFYNASNSTDMIELFKAGNDNKLIPISTFDEFKEGGGFNGKIEWVPLGEVIQALQAAFETRQRILDDIYQITGISDIVRGQSVASETATAQQLKAQFGSLRIQARQKELARFLRDGMRIVAEIMAEVFQPATLQAITETQIDEQMASFLRDDFLRTAKLDVESDATAALDEQAEKESRTEFVQAVTGFITGWAPILQQSPQMAPMASELLLFAVRAFKGGRDMEPVIETTFAQLLQDYQMQQQQQQMMAEQQAMMGQPPVEGAPGAPLPVDAPPGGGPVGQLPPAGPPTLPPPPGMPMQ